MPHPCAENAWGAGPRQALQVDWERGAACSLQLGFGLPGEARVHNKGPDAERSPELQHGVRERVAELGRGKDPTDRAAVTKAAQPPPAAVPHAVQLPWPPPALRAAVHDHVKGLSELRRTQAKSSATSSTPRLGLASVLQQAVPTTLHTIRHV